MPDLPGNSSGGSINILTTGYPDELEGKLKAKAGFNTKARKRFIEYDDNNPVGEETSGWDTVFNEYGGYTGGRWDLFGREVRLKAIGNWGNDFQTATGFQEKREPRPRTASPPNGDLSFGELSLNAGNFDLTTSENADQLLGYGGFGFNFDEAGNHQWDVAAFYTKTQVETVELKRNGFYADFDYSGVVNSAIAGGPVSFNDFNGSSTLGNPPKRGTETSWIGNSLGERSGNGSSELSEPQQGTLFFDNFNESKSFNTNRDLFVTQLNGSHQFDAVEGLHFRYVANYATTTQKDEARGMRYMFEPCGFSGAIPCPEGVARIDIPTVYPAKVDTLGPGRYFAKNGLFSNDNHVDESQYFARGDTDYETDLVEEGESPYFPSLKLTLGGGTWYEYATRDIDSNFLPSEAVSVNSATCPPPLCQGDTGSVFAVFGGSPQDTGYNAFHAALGKDASGDFLGLRETNSHGKREVQALHAGAKTTFFEDVDLLGGMRVEKIYIESKNDPFVVGNELDASPRIFPSKYLFFDRQDNRARGERVQSPPFNDQVLGVDVPLGPCLNRQGQPIGGTCVDLINRAQIEGLVNGEIDETKYLPAAGITYRPIEGLALRGAWSQTVARPSFREMGYYVSVEPGSDDQIVGNPQLQLSDVESFDVRAEYFWGDYGDLVAVSGFYKLIDDPIEQIIVRDSGNSTGDALYRTFFNNPNQATLWGIEFEARKNMAFLRTVPHLQWLGLQRMTFLDSDFVEYFSIGANFTWIDAEVDRSPFEIQRAQGYFGTAPGEKAPYSSLDSSRRLYGQPEWIVNADITFEQPDWGSRATLAFYGISDVLDAAGTAFPGLNARNIQSLTLDRYVDSFSRLDLVVSQQLWGGLALKFTAANLTNSKREIVYDPAQTSGKIAERSYKIGSNFSLEVSYSFTASDWLDLDLE